MNREIRDMRAEFGGLASEIQDTRAGYLIIFFEFPNPNRPAHLIPPGQDDDLWQLQPGVAD